MATDSTGPVFGTDYLYEITYRIPTDHNIKGEPVTLPSRTRFEVVNLATPALSREWPETLMSRDPDVASVRMWVSPNGTHTLTRVERHDWS